MLILQPVIPGPGTPVATVAETPSDQAVVVVEPTVELSGPAVGAQVEEAVVLAEPAAAPVASFNWVHVRRADGASGWVAGQYVHKSSANHFVLANGAGLVGI
jgi:hypothetical protein